MTADCDVGAETSTRTSRLLAVEHGRLGECGSASEDGGICESRTWKGSCSALPWRASRLSANSSWSLMAFSSENRGEMLMTMG